MFYRHVFDKISSEFCGILCVFCEFCRIWWIYLNFAAPRPHEMSEALLICSSLICNVVCLFFSTCLDYL